MLKNIYRIFSNAKIAVVGFLLILIPCIILSYHEYQDIGKRSGTIRENYKSTANLLCDKIENGIIRKEEKLTSDLGELQAKLISIDYLKSWLLNTAKLNPIIKNPFLLNNTGGVITPLISSQWEKSKIDIADVSEIISIDFTKAEEAEFSEKNFNKAAELYQEALNNAAQSDSAVLIAGIARCYLKEHDYQSAIEEYSRLLKFKDNNLTIGSVPIRIAALNQIADIYSGMKSRRQFDVLIEIYKNLIKNPWNNDEDAYNYYLKTTSEKIKHYYSRNSVADSIKHIIKDLESEKLKIYEDENYAKIIRNNFFTKGDLFSQYKLPEATKLQHLKYRDKNYISQFEYFIIPSSLTKIKPLIFGYQIDTGYIFVNLLPEILKGTNLGNDLYMGLLNQNDSVLYSNHKLSGQKFLAAENLSGIFSSWKIALFDREGKSIDQQIKDEKHQAFLLFGLTVFVLLIGIVIIITFAKHEYQISKLKSDFVSNVSHELKTPLSIIRMFGETLESGIVKDENMQQEFYGIIKRESERLTDLINNVLDFSRIESSKKEFNFKEANIVEVVNKVIEIYRTQITNLGFKIEVNLPGTEIHLMMDKDAISQALINLLNNAIKYSDERKCISINLYLTQEHVVISVADQGIGIDKKEFKNIFENFYRIKNSRMANTKGTGLGLTIAKYIVDAHKGIITVESEVGKGSKFTISIPKYNHLN